MATQEQIAEMARHELAADLGIPVEDIVVEQVEPVEWPDSSLGVPQPGYMYTQVITPGYRILLRHGAERYEYHANQGGTLVRYAPNA